MKSKSLLLLLSILCIHTLLNSCKNENELSNVLSEVKLQKSGTINLEDLPCTIKIGDKIITFELDDELNSPITKAAIVMQGPFYTTPSNQGSLGSSKKVLITKDGYKGVFFCDINSHYGSIQLPKDATMGKITIPSKPGYSNYSTQEKGINWNMTTTASGTTNLSYSFYTLTIRSNLNGQQMYDVIPVIGKNVQIPYYWI